MKAALQALSLIALAAALSAGAHWLRPDALPWRAGEFELGIEAVRSLPDPLWIDARTEEDFARGSVPGAVWLGLESWEEGFANALDRWTPERPIVVFCSTQACLRSREVAERLRAELGVEEVYALEGGWEALLAAGLAAGNEGPRE